MAPLPPLPDKALLADLCRETAAAERVEPQLVEKDLYLTRLLWALDDRFGEDPLAGDYSRATCHALSADEARAEKVRAAFTRVAIRDYYDLARLLDARADFTSQAFVRLVDRKLAELGAPALRKQPGSFGVDARRLELLTASVETELRAVLRADAPIFDLHATLRSFDTLWNK